MCQKEGLLQRCREERCFRELLQCYLKTPQNRMESVSTQAEAEDEQIDGSSEAPLGMKEPLTSERWVHWETRMSSAPREHAGHQVTSLTHAHDHSQTHPVSLWLPICLPSTNPHLQLTRRATGLHHGGKTEPFWSSHFPQHFMAKLLWVLSQADWLGGRIWDWSW